MRPKRASSSRSSPTLAVAALVLSSAVGRQLFDVEQLQALTREHLLHRGEGKIGKVLVVDGVELVPTHQIKQVRELHGDHAQRLEQDLQAADKIVERRDMRQDIVAEQQVGVLTLRL